MRILHLVTTLDWVGGIETYLLNLIPAMEANGIEQHVLYATGNPELHPRSKLLPIINQCGKSAEIAGAEAIRSELRRVEPDIVHIHNIVNGGVIKACLAECPTMITAHGYRYICPSSDQYYRRTKSICERSCGPGCIPTTLWHRCLTPRPQYALPFYRLARLFIQESNRFARLIAPSENAAQRYIRAGFPAHKTTILSYFTPIEPVQQPLGDPRRKTLLFIGRLRPYKGYDYFIEAIGRLDHSYHGLIVGDANDRVRTEIEELSRSHGCTGRIQLRNWVPREQMENLYRQVSALIFPSIWPETLGIVGLEAMSFGVPVIAASVGGVTEWLQHDVTGLLVEPKDGKGLALAAERLHVLEPDYRRMAHAGINLMKSKFNKEDHVTKLTEIYSVVSQTKFIGRKAHA